MSTKIAFDKCLVCSNEARTRAEYCDETTCSHGGMKKHACRIGEDGRTVCVSNHNSRFFDWSKVKRGADRTAFILGKVASAQTVGGAELAELLNISAPDEVYLPDGDWLARPAQVLEQIKLARTMANLEASLLDSDWALATRPEALGQLPGLDQVEAHERGGVLLALAQEKVALSLPEWLQLMTGASPEKAAAAQEHIQPLLPYAFQALLESDDLADVLRATNFTDNAVSHRWAKYAAAKSEERSLDKPTSQKRVWKAVLRQAAVPKEIKVKVKIKTAAAGTPAARALARHYAAYQINFLQNFGRDADFALTQELLVHQNRVS